MKFHIMVNFLHKESLLKKLEEKDAFTAIQKTLNSLDSIEKDNITAVKITYVE